MKGLLDNQFAPLTFTWGFVQVPFPEYVRAFSAWWRELSIEFDVELISEELASAFLHLQPLQTPQNKYLLTETTSDWTAVFSNGLRTGDVISPVGHMARILRRPGLQVRCIPDRSYLENKADALQIYGAVDFTLFIPGPDDSTQIRKISVMNDGGRWLFISDGDVQPFEYPREYAKKRLVDRFTPDMLEDYCAHLGIRLFDANFYRTDKAVITQLTRFPLASPRMSLREANEKLYLRPVE